MSGKALDDKQAVHDSCDGKKRIFIADDHALVREGLATLLEKTGEFEVVGECGDGLAVVQRVEETHPDVVVLDVGLRGLNGVDICLELKRRVPNVAVLMVSMHSNEDFIIRSLEYGARGYLLKESAGTDLVDALKAVMAGTLYLDSAIGSSVLSRLHKPRQDAYHPNDHPKLNPNPSIVQELLERTRLFLWRGLLCVLAHFRPP